MINLETCLIFYQITRLIVGLVQPMSWQLINWACNWRTVGGAVHYCNPQVC